MSSGIKAIYKLFVNVHGTNAPYRAVHHRYKNFDLYLCKSIILGRIESKMKG